MSKLTDAARDQECKVRIPGLCNGRPETTVLAHFRMMGLCGTGMKPLDLLGAHACSSCHDAIDGRTKTCFSRDALRLMHLEGVARTLDWAHHKGLINGSGRR